MGSSFPEPTPEMPRPQPLPVKWHHVDIQIKDQVAETAIDQVFINEHAQDLEATYLFPLPEEAAISEFAMYMDDQRVTGSVLEREEARRIYEDIVRKMRDPGAAGVRQPQPVPRERLSPCPPRAKSASSFGTRSCCGQRAASASTSTRWTSRSTRPKPLEEVAISVSIESKVPIKAVYSPTHKIDVHRKDDFHAVVGFEAKDVLPDQDFVLYYTVSREDFGLSLITHRPAGEDGFFLMLVAPKEEMQATEIAAKDIVFVFDTSGSMSGEKIKQAREALRFCVSKLGEGDRFNIVTFATDVETFSKELLPASAENVQKAQAFIDGIEAVGGTNIHEAMLTALDMIEGDRPSMVLFLTDGMPTVGETDEGKIVAAIARRNGGEPSGPPVVEGQGDETDGQKRFSLDLRGGGAGGCGRVDRESRRCGHHRPRERGPQARDDALPQRHGARRASGAGGHPRPWARGEGRDVHSDRRRGGRYRGLRPRAARG
jgi:Ca-activated chloride channel family protein